MRIIALVRILFSPPPGSLPRAKKEAEGIFHYCFLFFLSPSSSSTRPLVVIPWCYPPRWSHFARTQTSSRISAPCPPSRTRMRGGGPPRTRHAMPCSKAVSRSSANGVAARDNRRASGLPGASWAGAGRAAGAACWCAAGGREMGGREVRGASGGDSGTVGLGWR